MDKYGKWTWNEVRQCKTPAHVATWENFMGVHIPDGCCIHHIDQNKLNNNILNLVCITKSEHMRWHASHRSKEILQKMSEVHKKENLSVETLLKMSEAMKGNKHSLHKKHTEETKQKISAAMYGRHASPETKAKMSIAQSGNNNPMYGRHASPETKAKMSASGKGKPQSKVTCPYCGKTGGITPMKRWHFDNCKKREP